MLQVETLEDIPPQPMPVKFPLKLPTFKAHMFQLEKLLLIRQVQFKATMFHQDQVQDILEVRQ